MGYTPPRTGCTGNSPRAIAGHCNRKNAKALYVTGATWKHETVWKFEESKLWPEPTKDIPEAAATGKTTSPVMKYGLSGGYGKECLSPKLPDKLAKVLVKLQTIVWQPPCGNSTWLSGTLTYLKYAR